MSRKNFKVYSFCHRNSLLLYVIQTCLHRSVLPEFDAAKSFWQMLLTKVKQNNKRERKKSIEERIMLIKEVFLNSSFSTSGKRLPMFYGNQR